MAISKLMLTYAGANVFFLMTGGLIIGYSLGSEAHIRESQTIRNVAHDLLVRTTPLTAGIVNATFVFVTFCLSLLVFALPSSKTWLRMQGWLVVFNAIFTLIIGLYIWFHTLKTRANLSHLWSHASAMTQSLLQERFNCCGYMDSQSPPFVIDMTCPNPLVAIQKQGCVGPFAKFANAYLDIVFTAAFGIVGIDTILLLCIVMVIKRRQELDRYRHIDEKNESSFSPQ